MSGVMAAGVEAVEVVVVARDEEDFC